LALSGSEAPLALLMLTEKVKILHFKYEHRSCDHTSQLNVLDVVDKSFYDQLHQPVLGTADVWNYPLPTSMKHMNTISSIPLNGISLEPIVMGFKNCCVSCGS
jgi:hypothetical protein